MSFWNMLFNRQSHAQEEATHEKVMQHMEINEVGRVSCVDVARIIRERLEDFIHSQGMVVVLLEVYRIQIYYFDGVARASWGYNDQEFTTDMVGRNFLAGAPAVFALRSGQESELPATLQREFPKCEMSVGKLWKLDPTAWDYESMKLLHEHDVGVRISFDRLSEV